MKSDDVFGYVNEQDLFEAILSNSSEIFSRADTYIGIFLLLRDTLSMERKPSFSFAQRSRFSANKISQMIYFIMNLIYTISVRFFDILIMANFKGVGLSPGR